MVALARSKPPFFSLFSLYVGVLNVILMAVLPGLSFYLCLWLFFLVTIFGEMSKGFNLLPWLQLKEM
jgi:hypothetical protein